MKPEQWTRRKHTRELVVYKNWMESNLPSYIDLQPFIQHSDAHRKIIYMENISPCSSRSMVLVVLSCCPFLFSQWIHIQIGLRFSFELVLSLFVPFTVPKCYSRPNWEFISKIWSIRGGKSKCDWNNNISFQKCWCRAGHPHAFTYNIFYSLQIHKQI